MEDQDMEENLEFTSPGKHGREIFEDSDDESLSTSNHRSRDDAYKTNWNGFPLEFGGTCLLDKPFRSGYMALKSNEDAFASEIVDFLVIRAMHLGFGVLWQATLHTIDHSLAFYNANAALPNTLENVVDHLAILDYGWHEFYKR
ncbi:hypothetical protein CYMTET_43610 [Cymbomonas tetramitiformis]|uniref:Uncharacterized protein n=1 Tax=Cymbomonas tetramitiformis TaxID=36881 RepID=A0AAE0C3R1_9CHLO|nr:hypothetical protein CYMTET_43610 [Cymbomonas tetramitiformis]